MISLFKSKDDRSRNSSGDESFLNLRRILLLFVIASLPIMVRHPFESTLLTTLLNKIQLPDVFMGALIIFVFILGVTKRIGIRSSYFVYALILFNLGVACSLIGSENRILTAVDIVTYLYLSLFAFAVWTAIINEDDMWFAIRWWFYVSVVIASMALVGIILSYACGVDSFLVIKYEDFPYLGYIYRASGTFFNAKYLTMYLTPGLFGAILFLDESEKNVRAVLWGIIFLFLIVMFFTFSRGWVGISWGLVYLLSRLDATRSVRIARLGVLFVAVFLTLFFALISRWEIVGPRYKIYHDSSYEETGLNISYIDEEGLKRIQLDVGVKDTAYFELKKKAVFLFLEHPVFGVGAGTFRYRQPERPVNEEVDVFIPHSTPLGFLAETGLVGFILLVLLWSVLFAILHRGERSCFEEKMKKFYVLVTAILISFAIISIDMDIMKFRFVWFLFGICAACVNSYTNK